MDFDSLFQSVMERVGQEDRAYSSEAEFLSELTTAVFSRLILKLKECDSEQSGKFEELLKGRLLMELPDEESIDIWKSYINMRLTATRKTGRQNLLVRLLDRSKASPFEADLVAFLVNCRYDQRYMDIVKTVLSIQKDPDILAFHGLLADSFGRDYFSYDDNVKALPLIFPELSDRSDILSEQPVCDDRLMVIATGQDGSGPEGIDTLTTEGVKELLYRDKELNFAGKIIQEEDAPLLILYGTEGAGKRLLALNLAASFDRKLTICNIYGSICTDSGMDTAAKKLRYALRESMVNDSILLVRGLTKEDITAVRNNGNTRDGGAFRIFLDTVREMRALTPGIIVAVDTDEEPDTPGYAVNCFMKQYLPSERYAFWLRSLEVKDAKQDEVLLQTAGEFDLTPGQIDEAAAKYLQMDEEDDSDAIALRKKLHHACYSVIGHELAKKAKLIESAFAWDELKLPSKDKMVLRDICNAVQQRSVIMEDWNFKSKVPYGNGITVLFSGPPGTGKTMAAEVLANELQMELYKIDMSQVLDKYVGETEKHIREIFNLAKKGNFILFFDEADAIFNKRLDAKDANERFANIESSMLLQSIEEYDGIAILATNKMSALDPAFMRRFRFFIQFTEPDEKIACSIWKSVFPPEAPLDDAVDFKELAHVFTYTGAIIKNIALQAAYMAAGEKSSITLLHILKAVKREMEKNQRVMTREELGSLSYLYDEIIKERETENE